MDRPKFMNFPAGQRITRIPREGVQDIELFDRLQLGWTSEMKYFRKFFLDDCTMPAYNIRMIRHAVSGWHPIITEKELA